MDDMKAKLFAGQPDGESKESPSADLRKPLSEDALPKKRKTRHKKFIDLQKQPPKPKSLIQE